MTVGSEDRDRILAEERDRIAHILVPYARMSGYCNEVNKVWGRVFPGIPLVDEKGFNLDGWKTLEDGTVINTVGYIRPPQPPNTTRWCGDCNNWE